MSTTPNAAHPPTATADARAEREALERLVFGLEQASCYLAHSADCSCVVYSTGDGSDVCTCSVRKARRSITDAVRHLRASLRSAEPGR